MKFFLLTFAISLLTFIQTQAESIQNSLVRVNSTIQSWNIGQPWDKNPPSNKRALGVLLNNNRILTTAEMAANTSYIELENADKTRTIPAKVMAIDYETNLALLAPDNGDAKGFFSNLKPLNLATPAKIGDSVTVWQLEENGMPLITKATIQGVDVISSFASGHYFLTYEAKGSMQSASSSFTLPITQNGKLLGLLSSYSSKDQIINIITPEIISAFLTDTKDGKFVGTPSLGIGVSGTVDPNFRKWLKLPDNVGGLYITKIVKKSAAEKAGLQKGDVLLKIGNHPIGRRGYYKHSDYGQVFWSHLVRGIHKVGDDLTLSILREGKEQNITAKLSRASKKIIPAYTFDTAPNYLVKGGFIFQELSTPYFRIFGNKWKNSAPLNLLDALLTPENYEKGRNSIVFLSATIPTPATTGYERINNEIISKVNGQPIADMEALVKAFQQPDSDGLHTIEFLNGKPKTLYLDAAASDIVDAELLKRGIPALSRY